MSTGLGAKAPHHYRASVELWLHKTEHRQNVNLEITCQPEQLSQRILAEVARPAAELLDISDYRVVIQGNIGEVRKDRTLEPLGEILGAMMNDDSRHLKEGDFLRRDLIGQFITFPLECPPGEMVIWTRPIAIR